VSSKSENTNSLSFASASFATRTSANGRRRVTALGSSSSSFPSYSRISGGMTSSSMTDETDAAADATADLDVEAAAAAAAAAAANDSSLPARAHLPKRARIAGSSSVATTAVASSATGSVNADDDIASSFVSSSAFAFRDILSQQSYNGDDDATALVAAAAAAPSAAAAAVADAAAASAASSCASLPASTAATSLRTGSVRRATPAGPSRGYRAGGTGTSADAGTGACGRSRGRVTSSPSAVSDDSDSDSDHGDDDHGDYDMGGLRTASGAATGAAVVATGGRNTGGYSSLTAVSADLSALSIDDHSFAQARAAFARSQHEQHYQKLPVSAAAVIAAAAAAAAATAAAETEVPSLLAGASTTAAPAAAAADDHDEDEDAAQLPPPQAYVSTGAAYVAATVIPPMDDSEVPASASGTAAAADLSQQQQQQQYSASVALPAGMSAPARASGAVLSSFYSTRDLRPRARAAAGAETANFASVFAQRSYELAAAADAAAAAAAAAAAGAAAENPEVIDADAATAVVAATAAAAASGSTGGQDFSAWVSLMATTAANPLTSFALVHDTAEARALAAAWSTAKRGGTAAAEPLASALQGVAGRVVAALARDSRQRQLNLNLNLQQKQLFTDTGVPVPTLLCDGTAAAGAPELARYLNAVAAGAVTPVSGAAPTAATTAMTKLTPLPPRAARAGAAASAGAAMAATPSSASRKRRLSIGSVYDSSSSSSNSSSSSQSQTQTQTHPGPVSQISDDTHPQPQSAPSPLKESLVLGAAHLPLVPHLAAAALWPQPPSASPAQGHAVLPLSALTDMDANLGYDVTAAELRRGVAPQLSVLVPDERGRASLDLVDAMLLREREYTVDPDFLARNGDITSRMRVILLDWLSELAHEYLLGRETYHLAVSSFDRFVDIAGRAQWYRTQCAVAAADGTAPPELPAPFCDAAYRVCIDDVPVVTRGNLQLIGIACLSIAAKLDEIHPPGTVDLEAATDCAYSRAQIVAMEAIILRSLQWALHPPTVFAYVRLYLRALLASTPAPPEVASRRAAARAREAAVDAAACAAADAATCAAEDAARADAAAAADRMASAVRAGQEVEFSDALFGGGDDDDFNVVVPAANTAAARALDAARAGARAAAASAACRRLGRDAAGAADTVEAVRDETEAAAASAAAVDFPQYLLSSAAITSSLHMSSSSSTSTVVDSAAALASASAPFLSAHRFSRLMELLDAAVLDAEHVLLPASALSAAAVALVYPEARAVIPNVFDRASLAPALIFVARFLHLPFLAAGLPARPFYQLSFSDDEKHTRQTHHPGALAVAEAVVAEDLAFSSALSPEVVAEWNSVWEPSVE
jgi:hypothetical protein